MALRSFFCNSVATLSALALLCCFDAGRAQTTQWQPPTDSSAQASPLNAPAKAPVNDSSMEASPITPNHSTAGVLFAPQTPVRVVLVQGLNSGSLKNGQSVQARLASSISTNGAKRVVLQQGTPVHLVVVETVPAGKMTSAGEMSLQVASIGGRAVVTNILTFLGKPGHRDLPDSFPAKGTEAMLRSGAELTFHVQPEPVAAQTAPPTTGQTPGSVSGGNQHQNNGPGRQR